MALRSFIKRKGTLILVIETAILILIGCWTIMIMEKGKSSYITQNTKMEASDKGRDSLLARNKKLKEEKDSLSTLVNDLRVRIGQSEGNRELQQRAQRIEVTTASNPPLPFDTVLTLGPGTSQQIKNLQIRCEEIGSFGTQVKISIDGTLLTSDRPIYSPFRALQKPTWLNEGERFLLTEYGYLLIIKDVQDKFVKIEIRENK